MLIWSTGKALLDNLHIHIIQYIVLVVQLNMTHILLSYLRKFSHKHLQMMNSFLTLDPASFLMSYVSTEMLVKLKW